MQLITLGPENNPVWDYPSFTPPPSAPSLLTKWAGFWLAVRHQAGKQKDLGSIPHRFSSLFRSSRLWTRLSSASEVPHRWVIIWDVTSSRGGSSRREWLKGKTSHTLPRGPTSLIKPQSNRANPVFLISRVEFKQGDSRHTTSERRTTFWWKSWLSEQ